MHTKQVLSSIALLVTGTLTAPIIDVRTIDYTPPGGWESVKYPAGTGENLPYYPPPPSGWESVKYPAGTGANAASCDSSFTFTSTYNVVSTGSEVRNGTTPAPGPKEAVGFFEYRINSKQDTICYNITLLNVAGTPQSPASTATHIHQAARGASGPPRIAFPNPTGDDHKRNSIGCLKGPFVTGLKGADGQDTGAGFKVAQIEQNPAAFFTDYHTNLFPLGVVRGQLA